MQFYVVCYVFLPLERDSMLFLKPMSTTMFTLCLTALFASRLEALCKTTSLFCSKSYMKILKHCCYAYSLLSKGLSLNLLSKFETISTVLITIL